MTLNLHDELKRISDFDLYPVTAKLLRSDNNFEISGAEEVRISWTLFIILVLFFHNHNCHVYPYAAGDDSAVILEFLSWSWVAVIEDVAVLLILIVSFILVLVSNKAKLNLGQLFLEYIAYHFWGKHMPSSFFNGSLFRMMSMASRVVTSDTCCHVNVYAIGAHAAVIISPPGARIMFPGIGWLSSKMLLIVFLISLSHFDFPIRQR
ncbi:hypothetical protein AKJ16_DCAP11513 [Drosera capensis]